LRPKFKCDLARVAAAKERWRRMQPRFVPDQKILPGDETDRLHRWGYSHYRQMFSDRQLLGLELSCRLIHKVKDERIRHALATNLFRSTALPEHAVPL
jgi:adenine-specific DNA methylase